MKRLAKSVAKFLARLILVGLLLLAVFIGWLLARPPGQGERADSGAPAVIDTRPAAPPSSPLQPAPNQPPPAVRAMGDCDRPGFEAAAAANAASIDTLAWAPFRGRAETGWRTYGPRIAEEIGTDCAFDSTGFAEALARWQAGRRLKADGVMSDATFQPMRIGWDMKRPFQVAARNGCPPAPPASALEATAPPERYGGKTVLLQPQALAAYRRMVADARLAGVAADPALLTVFSGFRDPAEEAARCAGGGCGSAARAACSAHRTGTAIDINLGNAPGSRPDSSDDRNRRWMSQTPLYRWLVRNAGTYGFVNYAFEPWHWEWAGAGPTAAARPQ